MTFQIDTSQILLPFPSSFYEFNVTGASIYKYHSNDAR